MLTFLGLGSVSVSGGYVCNGIYDTNKSLKGRVRTAVGAAEDEDKEKLYCDLQQKGFKIIGRKLAEST